MRMGALFDRRIRVVSEHRQHGAAAVLFVFVCFGARAQVRGDEVPVVRPSVVTVRAQVAEGRDISFQRLPSTAGLSQTRVSQIAQDDDGFLWFGTQSGLNRYDGYKCKVFKHDPRQPGSLGGVFLYSLFKDHSGTLWVGSDQYLDRFDPVTETFHRIQLSAADGKKSVNFGVISQDRGGMLWLPTSDGLYGLNPASSQSVHYRHDPNDPASLNQGELQNIEEDRSGILWVGMRGGFDLFDRQSGKVIQRIQFDDTGLAVWLHEDRFRVLWVMDGNGNLGMLDRQNNRLTRFSFDPAGDTATRSGNEVLKMMEDRDGTMWFGTANRGLLKYDREDGRFVNYTTHPGDSESLPDSRVITLFQDREGNIWAGLHQTAPVFFSPKPPPFQKFTYQPGNPNSLGSSLVSVIHEDQEGVLWIGADRLVKRIDRKTGQYSTFPDIKGHEVLGIVEQGPDVMWMGTGGLGLKRYDRKTGRIKTYLNSGKPTDLCSDFVEKLMMDRKGRLWEAAWGGLCYLDQATEGFTRFEALSANRTYHAIAEDRDGMVWVGSNLGLQRIDPATGNATAFRHNDDPGSVSDNRINSIYQAQDGTLWIGTQNGLDRFDPRANRFVHFNEKDGLAGNVVACVLEDNTHRLWMSTNAGISSFHPNDQRFGNYSVADGLPGADLTGWAACFKSASGEMFFGGFSGAAAFYPDRITDTSYVPPVVLTGFRLFGSPVGIEKGSPLKQSITRSQSISLSHSQNIFSIEFSALSYVNPTANRYRYRLEGLHQQWEEASSEQRQATYTTLPPGDYTFRVQGATSRGAWSEPGAVLHIRIVPAFYQNIWLQGLGILAVAGLLWLWYRLRLRQMAARVNLVYNERQAERTRIARDLHDTLLQSFQGLVLRLQVVDEWLPEGKAKEELEQTLERADQAIAEGRSAVHDLRWSTTIANDLAQAVEALGSELATEESAAFRVVVEGPSRELDPILRDEIYRIAREAVRNAFHHAQARQIEVEITYGERLLKLRIRDDGRGMDPGIVKEGRGGHYGLPGIRERAKEIGGHLGVWSAPGAGTEIELSIPGTIAYGAAAAGKRWRLFRKDSSN